MCGRYTHLMTWKEIHDHYDLFLRGNKGAMGAAGIEMPAATAEMRRPQVSNRATTLLRPRPS